MPDPEPVWSRAFLILCFGIGLAFFSFFMVQTMAPLFSVALGIPPAAIGVVISAAFVLPFFLAIPAGAMVDRFGPKGPLLAGTALLGGAPILVTLAPSFLTLVILQVLSGLGQLLTVLAAQSFVASRGSGRARDRNFGVYSAFVSGGQLVGPVVAGTAIDLLGFGSAFVITGVVGFASFLLMTPLPATRPVGTGRTHALPRPAEVGRLLRVPSVQLGLMVSGTVMIGVVAHSSFLPAFLDLLAYPATVIGVIVSLRALTTLAVRPFIAPLVDRMGGRYRTFLAMLTLTALGLVGVAGGAQLAVLVIVSVMIGVGMGIAQPLTMVAVVEDVPYEEHGTAFGVRITANRLVQLTTPLVLGVVAQVAGYGAMFTVAGVLTAVTVATLAWKRRRFAGIDVRAA